MCVQKNTGWGKSRFTDVCMENNKLINKTRINYVSCTVNLLLPDTVFKTEVTKLK